MGKTGGTRMGSRRSTRSSNRVRSYQTYGEELVEKHVSNFYIIRTAWVFGNYGKNFVFTMQNLAKTHKTLTVVNDQHGRPTWTRTLAEFMTYLAENRKDYGYYHLSNDAKEDTTWYDFAVEILKRYGC